MSAPAPHLVLVGMMGVGKTTVGRILASRLGRPLLDSDDAVEARTGRQVARIFAEDGEPAFRAIEAEVLAEALASTTPAVIAAAGGVVLAAANRAALASGPVVVWLRADPALLTERAARGSHRPLLADDPAATLVRLAAEREPLYRDVADVVVDVEGRSADEVADTVLARTGLAAGAEA